jgi:hypothetical protein
MSSAARSGRRPQFSAPGRRQNALALATPTGLAVVSWPALPSRTTNGSPRASCWPTAFLFFFAGHETTIHLIGNGALTLLRHPFEMERLRELPMLASQAVEELLRFDSPVQRTDRVTLAEVEPADGQVIREGPLACCIRV